MLINVVWCNVMYLCFFVPMYLCIYLSIYLSIDLSIYLSIYLSRFLCIYLSIYLILSDLILCYLMLSYLILSYLILSYLSFFLSFFLSMYVSLYLCMPFSMYLGIYVSSYLCIYDMSLVFPEDPSETVWLGHMLRVFPPEKVWLEHGKGVFSPSPQPGERRATQIDQTPRHMTRYRPTLLFLHMFHHPPKNSSTKSFCDTFSSRKKVGTIFLWGGFLHFTLLYGTAPFTRKFRWKPTNCPHVRLRKPTNCSFPERPLMTFSHSSVVIQNRCIIHRSCVLSLKAMVF